MKSAEEWHEEIQTGVNQVAAVKKTLPADIRRIQADALRHAAKRLDEWATLHSYSEAIRLLNEEADRTDNPMERSFLMSDRQLSDTDRLLLFLYVITGNSAKMSTTKLFQNITGWEMPRVERALAEAHLAGYVEPEN